MAELINPYIAGAPVTEVRMFFGREDVFQWIENSIAGQYTDHILVIHGQRRVGKTSVLKQLGNRLPKRYIPVFFDLQGRTHTTLDRFLWWLAREIVRVLKQDRDIEIPLPEKESFSADLEYFENRFLPDLKPVLGDSTLLLTFDEFDNLEESEIKETLARPLIDHLRRLMGSKGLTFIFSIGSSGRKLENMQSAYTEFFKTALYKKISFLNEEQTHKLVTQPVEGVLEYDRASVNRIYKIAGGHPYFTQLTCHELFARCQQIDQRQIREADVEAVLDDVVERGTVNLKFVWDEASDIEKWTLAALAQVEGKADNRALADFLKKQRVRFSETDLASGLLHLREKDILTLENRFVIHLLRLWLQKNRPIEQAREELTEVNPIANRYIEIGLEFKDSHLYDKAIESFQEALAVAKDNIQAQANIALVYMDQKAYDKAIIEFEKALVIDDEDVSARAGLCEAHLALGDLSMQKGRAKEAVQSYQRVLAINAEHTEARQRMAEIVRQRAEKALSEGRDEEALSAFAEALKYTPEDPNLIARVDQVRVEKKAKVIAALIVRSEKEAGLKNWESAINALEEASRLSPEDVNIQKKLSEIKAAQEKSRLDGLSMRADAAVKSTRWNEAIDLLKEVLAARPDDEAIQNKLAEVRTKQRESQLNALRTQARTLAKAEKFDEALSVWNEFVELAPEQRESVQDEIEKIKKEQSLLKTYTEAQTAFTRKNYDRAIALFKEIIVQDEDYRDASRQMAEAIELRRTARKWWQSKWMWGVVIGLVVLVVGWLVFRFSGSLMNAFSTQPTLTVVSTQVPGGSAPTTIISSPTAIAKPMIVPLVWTRLNSGQFLSRAAISSVVFDPVDPGVMYVGAAGAGVYKSLDAGISWQPVLNGLGRSNISSLIIDPKEPKTLYAGVLLGGVYKTRDGAQTWHPINEGIAIPGGASLATVIMDPASNAHLYYTDSLGLYETQNGGENWTKIQMPSCPKIITSMVILPNTIYIADREKSAECELGIYRSRDGGKNWDLIPVNVVQSIQLHYWSLAVGTDPQERIYVSGGVAGEDKLYRTTDEGKTWKSIRDHRCYAMTVDPKQNGKIYCGGPNQLLVSGDWGDSWKPILRDKLIWELNISPQSEKTLVAGGDGSGLFISYDGGAKWSEQNSGLGGTYLSLRISPLDKATMFAEGGHRIYRSTTSGQTWNLLTDQGSGLAFDANKKTMYVLADVILKSEDGGKTWKKTAKTNQKIAGFVAHPLLPNMLIAIHDSGFSLSSDGGQTWDESNNIAWKRETDQIVGTISTSLFPDKAGVRFYILINSETTGRILRLDAITGNWGACQLPASVTTVNLLAIDPRDSNRIVISSPGNGLLISADGCSSWQVSNNGLGSLFVNALAIDLDNPDTIYAGTDGGAYISFDSGKSWNQINDGLLGATVVYSILVDMGSNVYAVTPYGIFKLEKK